jgi:hypothetical protein
MQAMANLTHVQRIDHWHLQFSDVMDSVLNDSDHRLSHYCDLITQMIFGERKK